jgi:hypothetical protein
VSALQAKILNRKGREENPRRAQSRALQAGDSLRELCVNFANFAVKKRSSGQKLCRAVSKNKSRQLSPAAFCQ